MLKHRKKIYVKTQCVKKIKIRLIIEMGIRFIDG